MRRLLLVLVMILLVLSSCRMDINLNGGNSAVHEGSCNWMGRLKGDPLVRDITIPATHDSCANKDLLGLSSISSTQDLDLWQQLEAGVRSLDIRIHERDGGYGIYHGPVYMDITLDEVVETCRTFLSENPSEFIMLFVQYEKVSDTDHHRMATPVVEALRKSDTGLFYQGSGLDGVRLSDVAGKIIPILGYIRIYREPDLISEWDFWLPDYEPGYDNEYYWQTQNPEEIWENSRSWLDRYSSGDVSYPADPGLISTSSYYYGQFGLPNYRIVSSYVNQRLQEYLEQYRGTGKCFGSIRADHMSRDLAHVIYSCNLFE